MKLIPIVLSGGSGTRLWPMSRTSYPKQFCPLLDDKSLQSLTLTRLSNYAPALIVTSDKLSVLTQKEITENKFKVEKVVYETEGKNTAAAIAVVCRYLELQNRTDEIVGVFSSDALIAKENDFHQAVDVACAAAEKNKIVTLGIKPDRIETGFGYIQLPEGSQLNHATSVLKFHEKPSYEVAKKFVSSGNFVWNAGIFIFKVQTLIEHFKNLQPSLWTLIQELKVSLENLGNIYEKVQSISIDVAILEKLSPEQLSCVPCSIGWSDLGSWDVLSELAARPDASAGLSKLQKPKVEILAEGNTIFSQQKKVYGLVGVDDLTVVDTADALLVCKKGNSQNVKDLVDQLKKENPKALNEHPFEIRPWGKFEILRDEAFFKSKIITVDPGQRISYQSHAHRSEHWVIVKGEATVVLNDEDYHLKVGQNIYIPAGAKHRVQNKSSEPVIFVEVQVGTYFGEDDIVRYQDDYKR